MSTPASAPDRTVVAYPGDPTRTYVYRAGELLVESRSQNLVDKRLGEVGAALLAVDELLDVACYSVPDSVDIPSFVDDLITADEFVRVSPNHVFGIAEEEEEAEEQDWPQGLGLVGQLLDTRPPDQPASNVAAPQPVLWVDTPILSHPVLNAYVPTGHPMTDGLPSEEHGTIALGAMIVRARVSGLSVLPAVDRNGFVDELALSQAIARAPNTPGLLQPGQDDEAVLVFLPLGGFTHGDKAPIALDPLLRSENYVIVAAAGNHGSERLFWPAAAGGVEAVGATDDNGRIAPWSGRGSWVDRYEPGAGIPTIAPPGRFVRASGTSIATGVFGAELLRTMAEQRLPPRRALDSLRRTEEPRGTLSTMGRPETGGDPPSSLPAPPSPVQPERPGPTPASPSRTRPRSRLAPQYLADSVERDQLVSGEKDPLRIRNDVDVLASVIASDKVRPPLSLAVFGDWGAGKTFFLNQVRLRVEQLSAAAKAAREATPPRETFYHDKICQIDFNAWQYVAGQELWASLVSRVFEGVRDHIGDDKDYLELMSEIAQQDAVVQIAEDRVNQAQTRLDEIAPPTSPRPLAELRTAQGDAQQVNEAVDKFKSALRGDGDAVDVREVQSEVNELERVGRRIQRGWELNRQQQSARVLTAFGIGFVVIATAIALLLPTIPRILTGLTGVLVAGAAVLTALLRSAEDLRRAGKRILGIDRRLQREYQYAEAERERAAEELGRLKREGPAGLYRFVSDRYRAEDYRQYLGMVPLIRQDLEQLSRLSSEGRRVDRIVLYIDDLDRCPTAQVVKVLEAVNLLFGFPLFVVVIAVDSRWLLHSVEHEFSAVLAADTSLAPSAQDYLEKIIQIPFWLRPMDKGGFGRLVNNLMSAPATAKAPDVGSLARAKAADVRGGGTEAVGGADTGEGSGAAHSADGVAAKDVESQSDDRERRVKPVAGDDRTRDMQSGDDGDGDGDGEPNKAVEQPLSSPPSPPLVIDLAPEALRVTPDEIAYFRMLAPLVSSPRAAKRLVNTYQLVRVSVEDVSMFLGNHEYRSLLLLLALVTTPPGLSVPMARSLLASGERTLKHYLDKVPIQNDTGSDGWTRTRARFEDIGTEEALDTEEILVADLRRWLPVVGRFSFNPGVAEAATQRSMSVASVADATAQPPIQPSV